MGCTGAASTSFDLFIVFSSRPREPKRSVGGSAFRFALNLQRWALGMKHRRQNKTDGVESFALSNRERESRLYWLRMANERFTQQLCGKSI
jgi:hypothetical protein